ncbi:MAG: PhoPQ-activated protein PqaA family protein [Pirellulaceae bacterium]
MDYRIVVFLILFIFESSKPIAADDQTLKNESPRGSALRSVVGEAFKTPKMHWLSQSGPIHSLTYEGETYQQRPTSVFAFYASPATLGRPSNETKFPAVVLIHGGGGTAFAEWVWLWAERGYAAIAMDLSGSRPIDPIFDPATGKPVPGQANGPKTRSRLPDGGPNHGPAEKFDCIDDDVSDDWPVHAASNVIRAHSLIRSFDDVDADRTAVTGISWGGYTTCLVASLDHRFQAAVPVYGCGFLYEGESVQKPAIDRLGDRRQRWIDAYDPSAVLPDCRVPILFVNGTNDVHYPLDSYQKSYDLVPGKKQMRIEVNMGHSHPAGWAPNEIGLFIDSHCRQGKALPKAGDPKIEGDKVVMSYQSDVPLKSAQLHFTSDNGLRSKRSWRSVPAEIHSETIIASPPPESANTWFLTLTDERDAMTSSSVRFVDR